MSKLLINEPSLKLLSALAMKIGQSPALILHKIHYEESKLKHGEEGYLATYPKLHERIPFISQPQIKRIIVGLENENLINSIKYKNTKLGALYSINHEKLLSLGFKCIDDTIVSKYSQSGLTLFILPSLAKEYGIAGAGILQQIHYLINSRRLEKIQLTHAQVNDWVPFVVLRQIERLFRDFETRNILSSELPDRQEKNFGKLYRINYQSEFIKLASSYPIIMSEPVDKYSLPISNVLVDKQVPTVNHFVDKKALPDHYVGTSPIIMSGPLYRSKI